jgi:catechol 2,3-dioxygenase-like lactoylglutathione lyase family enzyme
MGHGAWLGQPESADNPFILVVAQFFPETDPFKGSPQEVLSPFAHLGVELPSRDDIDEVAARAEADGRLAMPPTEMPPPIGYICSVRDPDGNLVEFSYDQGVYAKAREAWG